MDEAIIYYLKKENNLLIGEITAERIKVEIGSAFPLENEEKMEVMGRDLVTGLPKTIIITSQQIRAAIEKTIGDIINSIVEVLDETPPELASDIMKRGIVLSGGGGLLKGLAERVSRETHCPVYLAPEPLAAVALGAGKCAEDFNSIEKIFKIFKAIIFFSYFFIFYTMDFIFINIYGFRKKKCKKHNSLSCNNCIMHNYHNCKFQGF